VSGIFGIGMGCVTGLLKKTHRVFETGAKFLEYLMSVCGTLAFEADIMRLWW
jgi:hypothetical protein